MHENDIKFWRLGPPESTKRLAEWAEDMDYESTVICPLHEGHQRGGKRQPNLSIVLPGKTVDDVDDFVWTWLSECLVQDHVLELFRRAGLTGYEVKPVKARFKRTTETPPRLWELVVTGWAGVAPPESGIRLVEKCEGCGYLKYSDCDDPERLIDPSQWDGSDFFIVWPLPKFIFVTDRVAKLIRENRLTGVVLKDPRKLTNLDGFSPGRLSDWMPEARARELGGPLGID
ncbi:MAG: double-CXXCG motif protein [Armatimonadota bacterium]